MFLKILKLILSDLSKVFYPFVYVAKNYKDFISKDFERLLKFMSCLVVILWIIAIVRGVICYIDSFSIPKSLLVEHIISGGDEFFFTISLTIVPYLIASVRFYVVKLQERIEKNDK